MVVEQDVLFAQLYSGSRAPLSPVDFLHAWWHSAGGHLEGYQQQDSHEFYLSALSGLVLPPPPPSLIPGPFSVPNWLPAMDFAVTIKTEDWPTKGECTCCRMAA